jgi:hypothetical protein
MTYKITPPQFHFGAWDGSAACACGPGHFIGGTDEKNTLWLHSRKGDSPASPLLDLNPWLGIEGKIKNGVLSFKEADIEGAAPVGDAIYWIGSHGRDSDGVIRPERRFLFAVSLSGSGPGAKLEPLGKPYGSLVDAIMEDNRFQALQEAALAKKAPKEEGGFNIESLCAAGDALYIGFRNPILDGKALVLPLMNPKAVTQEGREATLGDLITLDLGGLGLRDMVPWRDGFLIVGGDFRDRFEDPEALDPKLFFWDGTSPNPVNLLVDLGDLNPEAAVVFGEGDGAEVMILSDDGKWNVQPGEIRKDAEDAKRRFRSAWLVS